MFFPPIQIVTLDVSRCIKITNDGLNYLVNVKKIR